MKKQLPISTAITNGHLAMSSIRPGIYRHYKGNLYEVIGTAQHSETEELMIVYRALYGDYGLWIRPLTMFEENIIHNGKHQARFALIQPFNE